MTNTEVYNSKKEYELLYDYRLQCCEVLDVDKHIKLFFKNEINELSKNEFALLLYKQLIEVKNKGGILKFEKELLLVNGELKYYYIQGKYIKTIDTFVGVLVDDTVTKQDKDKSVHEAKLRCLGELAGGIAHDFNNQLMVILGSCELISKRINDDKILYYIKNIISSAKQSSDLINKLLIFGNSHQIPKTSMDFTKCVQDCLTILQQTTNSNRIKVIYESFAPKMYIQGNYGLIQNAVLNLCKNSIEAFKGSGVLMIKTDCVHLDEIPKYTINNPLFEKGLYGLVQITDNACGMEKEIIEKIFDPFFTTKGFSNNNGLGLSTVLGTVDMHQGLMNIKSVVDHGSVFSIYIKLEKEVERMSGSNRQEILVIDDEYLVRMILRDILVDLKYNVKCFETGQEGIQYYQENKEKVSLIICDMMMPGLTGREVYHKLRDINEEVKFIILSGFSNEEDDEVFNKGIISYLRKPIMLDTIKDVVSKTLK